MSFLAELRRRNVIRMAGLYLVGAWLFLQIAETLLPIFDTPAWVLKALVMLLALGFVPAMVLSWLFELTPEGIKRDGTSEPGQLPSANTAQRMDRLLLLGLIAVAGLVLADRFWPRGTPSDPSSSAAKSIGVAQNTGLVAVLPFQNRSVREEDAFLAEGIHDDLLTQLSKVASLRVISRTSMMRYLGSDKSIREIASETGAAVVLEGAVQRSGNQVRINMQLIDGSNDEHLWAETYDRELSADNLFAIQADIARVVTRALKTVLTADEEAALTAGSTGNVEAYQAFLQGKLLLQRSNRISPESVEQVLVYFDRAIALDPAFADAWARKARAQVAGYWFSGDQALRTAATTSLEQAKRLAPQGIETWLAEAYYAYAVQQDYRSAEALLQQVLQRLPEHAEAWLLRGYVARRDGRFDDALRALQRSLQIDPVNEPALDMLPHVYLHLGRFDQAAVGLAQADQLGIKSDLTAMLMELQQGKVDAAWAAVNGPDRLIPSFPYRVARASRDPERIAQALSPSLWPEDLRQPRGYPEDYALAQAEALLLAGQREQAMTALRDIEKRMLAMANPYPDGWRQSAQYLPCQLPGLLGDLDGVRAAERSYLDSNPTDVVTGIHIRQELAAAFALAGDPARAIEHLEFVAKVTSPASFLTASIDPRLDSIRTQPGYLALKSNYERWASEQPP